MPVDASIYGLQQKQIDPLEQYGKVANLRALMDESKLRGLHTQKAERDFAEEDALRKVFSEAPQGASLESLLPDVYRASPKAGVDFQGKVLTQNKDRLALEKTQQELQAARAKDARDMLAGVSDQPSYDAWRQQATVKGYQIAKDAPPVFDPKWQQSHIVTADQFIANLEHQKNRDVTLRGQNMTDARAATTATETARHHGAIEGDPTTIENTAQAIAKGDLAPLSGFSLARPMGQQIMSRVVAINPEFNPTAFATRQKVEDEFAKGKAAQSVRSFNVGISHLGTLDALAEALQNKDMQLFNKIGNTIATQTGSAAPTNFEAAKKIVADEIVKAIVGSGGGVADREEAAKTIQAASSPAQLKGVISTYKELMKGQLDGLRKQYQTGGGRKDFDKEFLSDESRAVIKGNGAKPSEATAARKPGGLVPAKGTVQEGYRFKGGDPSKPESWEKV